MMMMKNCKDNKNKQLL